MRLSCPSSHQHSHQRARRRERFARRAQQLVSLFRSAPGEFLRLAQADTNYYSLLTQSVLSEPVRFNHGSATRICVCILCGHPKPHINGCIHTCVALHLIVLQFCQSDSQGLVECAYSVLGDDEQSGGEDGNFAVVRHGGLTPLGM